MSTVLQGAGASGAARRAVRSALTGRSETEVEDAALLVSELVTNAIVHGGDGALLAIEVRDRLVRISVTDLSHEVDLVPQTVDPASEHGRGLAIVDRLACAWGVEPSTAGKTVWVELDVA